MAFSGAGQHAQDAPVRLFSWFYRRLGPRYPGAFLAFELTSGFVITAATVALLSSYYDASLSDYMKLLAITEGLAVLAVVIALIRTFPRLEPLRRWIAGERDEESTAKGWATAVGLPLESLNANRKIPIFMVLLPSSVAVVAVLGLSWPAFFPVLAAGTVSLGYAAILHYLAFETGLRPVLIDINQQVTPRISTGVPALPLRVRLMGALPLINIITGLTVAALTSGGGGGGAALGADVLIAVGVATTISLELTVMLTRSILRPINDLQVATDAIREGRYDTFIPVTTGDELGELAASFNEMIAGLAERERIREAFGTYLDKEVAEYILSDEFSEEGVEADVSLLFLDVRDFTSFAASAEAEEVVARLNELFEQAVPIVARHGGHVDKFVGDGLLAVFGAPEPFPDHADRAVRAACQIATTVNDGGPGFQIGIGVNSGKVVAGSIGGAGRLNFSVIGDAVNVASRVEAATRELDKEVLITAGTAQRLTSAVDVEPCGAHQLKGIDEPVELFAPRISVPQPSAVGADEEPVPASGDGAVALGRAEPSGLGRGSGGGLAQL